VWCLSNLIAGNGSVTICRRGAVDGWRCWDVACTADNSGSNWCSRRCNAIHLQQSYVTCDFNCIWWRDSDHCDVDDNCFTPQKCSTVADYLPPVDYVGRWSVMANRYNFNSAETIIISAWNVHMVDVCNAHRHHSLALTTCTNDVISNPLITDDKNTPQLDWKITELFGFYTRLRHVWIGLGHRHWLTGTSQ